MSATGWRDDREDALKLINAIKNEFDTNRQLKNQNNDLVRIINVFRSWLKHMGQTDINDEFEKRLRESGHIDEAGYWK